MSDRKRKKGWKAKKKFFLSGPEVGQFLHSVQAFGNEVKVKIRVKIKGVVLWLMVRIRNFSYTGYMI